MAQNKSSFNPNEVTQRIGDNSTVLEVTAAATLEPHQTVVRVIRGSAGNWSLTLPPVASCPFAEFFIFTMDAGTGDVDLVPQSDEMSAAAFAADPVTAAKDYWFVKNMGGHKWLMVSEVTT